MSAIVLYFLTGQVFDKLKNMTDQKTYATGAAGATLMSNVNGCKSNGCTNEEKFYLIHCINRTNMTYHKRIVSTTRPKSGMGASAFPAEWFENGLNQSTQGVGAPIPDWGTHAPTPSGRSELFQLPVQGFAVNVQRTGRFPFVAVVGLEDMGNIKPFKPLNGIG